MSNIKERNLRMKKIKRWKNSLCLEKIIIILIIFSAFEIIILVETEASVLSSLNIGNAVYQKVKAPVLTSETVTKPTLAWNNIGSKYTYRIYRSDKKNGTYICLVKELNATRYIDKSAVAGQKYYYKIRATKVNQNGKISYGNFSKPLYIEWVKDDIILTLDAKGKDSYLQWTSLKNSKYKYSIWKSGNVNGKFVCVKNDLKKNQYKLNMTSKTGLFYYKVRPYKIKNGKKIYGEMSNICLNKQIVDVVIFMGQSNMAGRGENEALAPQLEINTGFEYRAVTDSFSLYHLTEPFGKYENVVGGLNDVSRKTGIEVKSGGMVAILCKTYFENTGIPIVAVSASISGTSVKKFQPGGGILADAVNRLNQCKIFLNQNKYNIRHVYMVWCQGESDRNMETECYIQYMKTLIEEMRQNGVEMCFVIQTGERMNEKEFYKNVQEGQKKLCNTYEYAYLATDIATTFINKGLMRDEVHYSQLGYNVLGKETGIAMAQYVNMLEK